MLSAQDLKQKADRGEDFLVLDFANSLQYRRQHIPDALWAMRTRLDEALSGISATAQLVATSPDGLLAQYVANDLSRDYPGRTVVALRGGTRSWIDAGLPTASGAEHLTTEPNDIWYKPYEQASSVRDAMQGYLDWEVNLVAQIKRDGDANFL
jgi:rhodanese-related sulfurtransferase